MEIRENEASIVDRDAGPISFGNGVRARKIETADQLATGAIAELVEPLG